MADQTDTEPSVEERPQEQSEVQGGGPEPDAAPTNRSTSTGSPDARAGSGQPPQTVFVPNPNGYPRPATAFLPAHPWLRLPSRPPDHETVSHN